jgi:hypothetical protein
MTKNMKKYDALANQLHRWYLEATLTLDPKNYNPDAQKKYEDLNEEQKFIDRYIAMKVSKELNKHFKAGFEAGLREAK